MCVSHSTSMHDELLIPLLPLSLLLRRPGTLETRTSPPLLDACGDAVTMYMDITLAPPLSVGGSQETRAHVLPESILEGFNGGPGGSVFK